jgi:hypothetical protein
VRYTAPSVVFRMGECPRRRGLAAAARDDVLIANLDPTLERMPPLTDVMPLLEHFADGLATAEVAALLADARIPFRTTRARARVLNLAARDAVGALSSFWVEPSTCSIPRGCG